MLIRIIRIENEVKFHRIFLYHDFLATGFEIEQLVAVLTGSAAHIRCILQKIILTVQPAPIE